MKVKEIEKLITDCHICFMNDSGVELFDSMNETDTSYTKKLEKIKNREVSGITSCGNYKVIVFVK